MLCAARRAPSVHCRSALSASHHAPVTQRPLPARSHRGSLSRQTVAAISQLPYAHSRSSLLPRSFFAPHSLAAASGASSTSFSELFNFTSSSSAPIPEPSPHLTALLPITATLVAGSLLFAAPFLIVGRQKLGGVPYMNTTMDRVETMLAMLEERGVKPEGSRLIDIGSGDGRIVISAAQKGYTATGVELNPFLCYLSKMRANRAGVAEHAEFLWKNFWKVDLSPYNVVTVYGTENPEFLNRLCRKLAVELRPGAYVLSNTFALQGRPPLAQARGILLYQMGEGRQVV